MQGDLGVLYRNRGVPPGWGWQSTVFFDGGASSSARGFGEPLWEQAPTRTKYSIISRVSGGLGRIRTPDPLIRSQVLYPTELPVREGGV